MPNDDQCPPHASFGQCSSCRAPIWRVMGVHGEKVLLEQRPDPVGTIEMIQLGGAWRAQVLAQREALFDVDARLYWRLHTHVEPAARDARPDPRR